MEKMAVKQKNHRKNSLKRCLSKRAIGQPKSLCMCEDGKEGRREGEGECKSSIA
jgi:hypothetical protein